jgi:hypothetical protein
VKEGRFGTVIRHRVTVSFGLDPAWPYAGVTEMFDYEPVLHDGMRAGASDWNGGCIWWDYVSKHGIPLKTATEQLYGGTYETALRQAFFRILMRYPRPVLRTFFYYKPRYIVWSMAQSLTTNFRGVQLSAGDKPWMRVVPYPPATFALLLASLGGALAYFCLGAMQLAELKRMGAVAMLSALFTISSYLAVWALLHTSADLLFYCLFAIGLAAAAIVMSIRPLVVARAPLHA